MFIKGWSRQQKRKFWRLVFVFASMIIAILGALGSWMPVPEFRKVVGLDPIHPLPESAVAKASPAPNPRNSNRPLLAVRPTPEAVSTGRKTIPEPRKSQNMQPKETTVQSVIPKKQIETPSNGNTISINSMEDSRFGIGAELKGVLRINPEWIEVEIPNPSLRLHSTARHRGPRELKTLQAAVGTFNHSEPWRTHLNSSSQPVPVGRTLNPGEKINLKPLKFIIPKKGLADLSSLQLIFLIDNKAVVTGKEGNKTRAYAYSKL